jgi:16S rRNA (guanine1516-N2)-methyltransferase
MTKKIVIDFLAGAVNHRRQFGGGKNQLIGRAVGIKSSQTLSVLDVTAGLGRDAFVLATLGCDVVMCERSPDIYTLLREAMERASTEVWFQQLSFKLIHADAIDYLAQLDWQPDVIYIDPMYPPKSKSALPKQEMILLREVVGDDLDSATLFELARQKAKKRVVVKRARLAPMITDRKPDVVFEGKSSRFDVYLVTTNTDSA